MLRAGLRGLAVIGGTEFKFVARERVWIAHVHFLVLRTDAATRRALKNCGDPNQNRAVVIQTVRDPLTQISYLQKFATYHRPGVQRGNYRARAYPLPPAPFRELMAFYATHGFTDFLFLFGVRRRGAKLVLEPEPHADVPTRLRGSKGTLLRKKKPNNSVA